MAGACLLHFQLCHSVKVRSSHGSSLLLSLRERLHLDLLCPVRDGRRQADEGKLAAMSDVANNEDTNDEERRDCKAGFDGD